jgi:hypothetical protein
MGGVVTFLKKAGTLLVNTVSVIELGYPILGRLIPKAAQGVAATIVNDLEQFSGVVTTIEQVGASIPAGLSGEQRFAAALPGITQAVAGSSVMAGKKIANQTLFQKACAGYAQATVDLLNSLDPASIVTK